MKEISAAHWVRSYWRWIVASAIVLVVAIAWFSWQRYAEDRNQVAFSQAFYQAMQAPDRQKALSEIKARYGDLPAAQWLALEQIAQLAQQKEWATLTQTAHALAQDTQDKDIRTIAFFLAAHGAENEGNSAAALDFLGTVVAQSPVYAPLARAEKDRLLAVSGKSDEAKADLNAILTESSGLEPSFKVWVENLLVWIQINESSTAQQP